MCHDGESFNRFHAAVAPSKEQMIAEGFSAFAVEDFYDSFMEQLEKLDPQKNSKESETITGHNGNSSNGTGSEQKEDKTQTEESKLGKSIIDL